MISNLMKNTGKKTTTDAFIIYRMNGIDELKREELITGVPLFLMFLSGKIEQGQEEEVDGHAGEMVLELGRLAHILGIAKSDGRVAKETSCYTSQGIKIIFGHKDKAENDDEDGPKDCPRQVATADMFGRIA